jgi:hypothetical protein
MDVAVVDLDPGSDADLVVPRLSRTRGRARKLLTSYYVVLICLALVSGAVWAAVVPPFEAPDESWFYRQAAGLEKQGTYRYGLFHVLTEPVVRRGADDAPVDPTPNPAFRFVSNRRGEVNMFLHAPAVRGARAHLRRLYLLRAVIVVVTALTIAAVFATAHLVLGSAPAALVVAAATLLNPQFSFVGAVVHPEALARLLGALVTLVLVARATGAIGRLGSWLLLAPLLLAVPFTDRQAFFLVPFAALGLVIVEPRWRARLAVAAALGTIAALTIAILPRTGEAWSELAPWLQTLRNPVAPFLSPDPSRGATPPTFAYYLFEFAPKMFLGFWGWLGQPSVLLPAWLFGGLAAATLVTLAGLAGAFGARWFASVQSGRVRWNIVVLFVAGIGLMLLPIVYAPAVAGRNLWYGRWLFPFIGPIMIAVVTGLTAFASAARRHPHAVAVGAALAAATGALLWMGEPGARVRHGIAGHHYGDQAHLLATIRASLIALAFVPIVTEGANLVRRSRTSEAPRRGMTLGCAWGIVVALVAANAAVLLGFVAPRYKPLGPAEYVVAIEREVGRGDYSRAAGLNRHARSTYPDDEAIRRLAMRMPRLLVPDTPDESALLPLEQALARGARFSTNADLRALARALRVHGWRGRAAIGQVAEAATRDPRLREGAGLLQLQLGDTRNTRAVADFVENAGITNVNASMRNGEADLVGFSLERTTRGVAAVTVYFVPRREWVSRRFWLHAYPPGSHDYVDVPAVNGPFERWMPGELAWETFEMPTGDAYVAYVGFWVGNDIGPAYLLGTIAAPK